MLDLGRYVAWSVYNYCVLYSVVKKLCVLSMFQTWSWISKDIHYTGLSVNGYGTFGPGIGTIELYL